MDEFALQGLSNMSNGLINLANSIGAAELDRTNRAFAERMTKQQQEWARSMYDYSFKKTTDYASPSSQLQRLLDAGINPNSAAASVAGGNTQGTPVMPSAGMASYQSVFHPMDATLNPTESLLDIAAKKELVRGQKIENDYRAEGLELSQEEQRKRLDKFDAEISKLITDNDISKENLDVLRQSAEYLVSKNRSDADSASQTFKNLLQTYDNLKSQKRQIEASTDNIKEDTRYKAISNDYTAAVNSLRQHLVDIGIDPDSRGADRFLEFVLDSPAGRKLINRVLDIGENVLDVESKKKVPYVPSLPVGIRSLSARNPRSKSGVR